MQIDPWILAFSAVTVVVTIWMGFWSAKKSKTASDFFVAGRSVSVGWNASAISGEYLSAASFMGVAGMVMSSGYDALWYPVCYACGYLFLLLFIAGPLRRFGAYTIPDFAEGRFDSPLFRKIAVVFVLFIGFFYTMPQMKGAGTTLAYIFPGLPYWAGVVLVGAVITLNVALGGMKGITLVQAFQYWAKMFAISVPIFVLMAVYGHYGRQVGVNDLQPIRQPLTLDTNGFVAIRDPDLAVLTPSTSNPGAEDRGGRPWSWTVSPEAAATMGLSNHLFSYSRYVGVNVLMSPGLGDRKLPPFLLTSRSRSVLANGFKEILGTNGIVIVEADARNHWVSLRSEEADLRTILSGGGGHRRAPLPPKAPADETWLNPFGPLTTKAAKAAASALTNEHSAGTQGLREDLRRQLIQIAPARRSDLSPPPPDWQIPARKALGEAGLPVRDFGMLADQPGTNLFPLRTLFTNYATILNRPIWVATNILNGSVTLILTNYVAVHAETYLPKVNAAFTNHAIAVIKDSQGNLGFVSIETAPILQSLRSFAGPANSVNAVIPFRADQAWLTKHERPLALLYTYSLIIALVCGTAGLPHILVRFYTNPDGVAAKRTTMWVMILIGVFYLFPPVFGVIGRNLMPDLYTGLAGIKGTDQVVLKLPTLLNEQYGVLGSILSGITCAGAFAAFMSTFSGLLVSMTGALAHDVYGRILRPNATAEQRLRMFKIAAVLIGGVAIVLGSFVEPLEINFMVGQAFAIAAASYFPLLFMSVWWRGMTIRGAATGMLVGGLCALAGATLTNVSNLALDKGPMGKIFAGFAPLNDFWAAQPLLRILCEQPAIWAVPLAIVLMVVVSKLTKKDVPADIRMKMLVLHAPEKLGLKQEYIEEHQHGPEGH
jgi:Na+(H+)/acetate symporter ActP